MYLLLHNIRSFLSSEKIIPIFVTETQKPPINPKYMVLLGPKLLYIYFDILVHFAHAKGVPTHVLHTWSLVPIKVPVKCLAAQISTR